MTNAFSAISPVPSQRPAVIYDLPPEVFGQILFRGTDLTTATLAFKNAFEEKGWDWRTYENESAVNTLRSLGIERKRSIVIEDQPKESATEQLKRILKEKFQALKVAYPLLATSIAEQSKTQHLPEREVFEAMQKNLI